MAQNLFCFAVPLKILFAAVLSVATGVDGFWWPISDRSVFMAAAFWNFPRNPTNSASVADTRKLLTMIHSTCTGTFLGGIDCIGVLYFGLRKKYPPDLLSASSYEI